MSYMDILLIVLMFISGLLAMMRGFTREVLSIMSWALAAVAALFAAITYSGSVDQYINQPIIAFLVTFAGVFVVVLIIATLLTASFSDKILDTRVGALDRTLGFIFGLGRGFILVVVLYILYSALVQPPNQPKWILEARSLPYIKQTGDFIISVLPETIPGLDRTEEEGAVEEKNSRLNQNQNLAKTNQDGYRKGERQGLEQLLEGVSNNRN